MLRGDMDPGIDKFEIIEKLMAEDLENWLCNFYFEIIKLPRYLYLTFYKHKWICCCLSMLSCNLSTVMVSFLQKAGLFEHSLSKVVQQKTNEILLFSTQCCVWTLNWEIHHGAMDVGGLTGSKIILLAKVVEQKTK